MSDPVDAVLDASDAPLTVATTPPVDGAGAPARPAGLVPQASTDAQLLALWRFGRSPHTQRAYRREAARFRAHAGRPRRVVTLGDPPPRRGGLLLEVADVLRPGLQAGVEGREELARGARPSPTPGWLRGPSPWAWGTPERRAAGAAGRPEGVDRPRELTSSDPARGEASRGERARVAPLPVS